MNGAGDVISNDEWIKATKNIPHHYNSDEHQPNAYGYESTTIEHIIGGYLYTLFIDRKGEWTACKKSL